ncbi:MAG: glycosyltransferase family 2 protein [Proteobacteria bacterium]|nr:glycosyltransferase family 2 protein [Pseudomonadota bacterium]
MSHLIDILLSTYNGAEYLNEQLTSIAAQDIDEWRLIVRDDGSTDSSVSIIKAFVVAYPDRVQFISEPSVRLGVVASYEYLLSKSRSQYIAFCDQDDVWLPDKLKILRESIQDLESMNLPEMPILIHSDLRVVNEYLEEVADSFWKYQKLNPTKMQTLQRLLVQNCVTGCALMINRSLLNHVLPIPKDAIMHDWWISLIAVSKGKVHHINLKTVKYRQYADNVIGAKKWSFGYIMQGISRNGDLYKKSITKTRNQAKALLQSGKLSGEKAEIVSQYVDLYERDWLDKRMTLIRLGFLKYGFIRNVAFIFWV